MGALHQAVIGSFGGAAPWTPTEDEANLILTMLPGTEFATLYGERTSTLSTVVTADAAEVGTLYDELKARRVAASGDTRKPLIEIAGGDTRLKFNGIDDYMRTSTSSAALETLIPAEITTDKLTVFVSFLLASDIAADGAICEMSASWFGNDGTFSVRYTHSNGYINVGLRGTASGGNAYDPPGSLGDLIVLTAYLDIAGATRAEEVIARINGTVATAVAAVVGEASGTGNFATNQRLGLGSRDASSNYAKMSLSGLLIYNGIADATKTARIEAYLTAKGTAA